MYGPLPYCLPASSCIIICDLHFMPAASAVSRIFKQFASALSTERHGYRPRSIIKKHNETFTGAAAAITYHAAKTISLLLRFCSDCSNQLIFASLSSVCISKRSERKAVFLFERTDGAIRSSFPKHRSFLLWPNTEKRHALYREHFTIIPHVCLQHG